jgi:uncharacterized coiled-coil protein SlyX
MDDWRLALEALEQRLETIEARAALQEQILADHTAILQGIQRILEQIVPPAAPPGRGL